MRKIPLAKFFKVIITNKKSSKTFLLLDLFVKETKHNFITIILTCQKGKTSHPLNYIDSRWKTEYNI